MTLHANYAYLFDKIKKSSVNSDTFKVLDYGCGKGSLVDAGVASSIDFYGVELFGSGSGINIKEEVAGKGLLGSRIKEIFDNKIPFPDKYFDMVVSNQVFEHIPEIGPVVSEITRVLRPGGEFLCITPYQGSFREGHCEIPFAHWFRAGSRLQYYWLYAFKTLGFGRRKKVKDPGEWAAFFSTWLKENTSYDSYGKIDDLFEKQFKTVQYVEDDYLAFRLSRIGKLRLARLAINPLVRRVSQLFVRKYGGLVIQAQKMNQVQHENV